MSLDMMIFAGQLISNAYVVARYFAGTVLATSKPMTPCIGLGVLLSMEFPFSESRTNAYPVVAGI
jgi:hypothetical protein